MSDNWLDNIELRSDTKLHAKGDALIVGTSPGAKSLVFSNDQGEAHLAVNVTGNATINLPAGGGNIVVASQAINIAAGTQTASSGTVVFSNSNNVTFGMSNSSVVTASASYSQSTAPGAFAAGTQTATSGTVVLSNSNGISFGMSGSSQVTASADYVRSLSAGTTNATGNQVVFANSNGVTFGANGATITGSVAAQSTQPAITAISAGTTSATSGNVVFGNANGVTFGLSAGTGASSLSATVTASYSQSTAPAAISAGTTSASSGTIVFSNANSVTFGMNGNTITASVQAGAAAGIGAAAAGTQTQTSGTLVFANSNNITFGMSGSSQITASFSGRNAIGVSTDAVGNTGSATGTFWFSQGGNVQLSQVTSNNGSNTLNVTVQAAALAAGTQTATSGTVVFANSNNVTFGLSGSSQVTASFGGAAYNYFSYPDQPTGSFPHSDAGMSMIAMPFPGRMTATQIMLIGHMTGASASSGGLSMSFGVYTMSGSTASLASSNSAFMSWTSGTATSATNSASAYGVYSGTQYRVATLGSWNMTPGNYLLALWFRSTNAGTFTWWGQSQSLSLLDMTFTSQSQFWLNGYSTSSFSTAMPASINITDTGYVRDRASWNRQLGIALLGSV